VARAPKAPDQVIQVLIRKDEGIDVKLDEKTMSVPLVDLASTVSQAQAGRPPGSSAVVIAADKNVKYEVVVNVMDRLQRAGVQRVGLSVQLAK
jgi:biopolymer transport protein TolR